MNLVGTLAKVAMGIMVTKGIGKMLGRGGSGSGLGGLLGGLLGGAGSQGSSGGLGDLLGKVLTGGSAGPGAASADSPGSLGDLLNGMDRDQRSASGGTSFGELLNEAMGGRASANVAPEQNAQAELLLRGMINAAKCDGQIDQAEQRKLLEHLGSDVSAQELDFVRTEMAQPLDLPAFVRSVPRNLAQQVYVMSLLGIDLDSKSEAQYLDQLASGLGISRELSNQIHKQVGVPALYG